MHSVWLSTGSSGLDWVLDPVSGRGFCADAQNPLKITLSGGYGSGKSRLAAQLALRYLIDNPEAHCIYLALEERRATIVRRVDSLAKEWKMQRAAIPASEELLRRLSVVEASEDAMRAAYEEASAPPPACPYLCPAPVGSAGFGPASQEASAGTSAAMGASTDFWAPSNAGLAVSKALDLPLTGADDGEKSATAQIANLVAEHPSGECPNVFIIDSLNALPGFDEKMPRILRVILADIPVLGQFWTVLIHERSDEKDPDLFISDAVIEMGVKSSGKRYLSVSKARDHVADPLHHDMVIQNDGVHVYPHPGVIEREAPWPFNGFGKPLGFAQEGLNGLLVAASLTEKDFRPGSTTLFHGPHDSFKTKLALRCLAVSKAPVVVVQFGQSNREALAYLDEVSRQEGRRLPPRQQRIISDLPMPLDLPRLLHRLRKELEELLKETKRPPRILVDDIGVLEAAHDPEEIAVIVRTLCRFFQRKRTSAFFVWTPQNESVAPEYPFFDNVFAMGYTRLFQPPVVGLHAKRLCRMPVRLPVVDVCERPGGGLDIDASGKRAMRAIIEEAPGRYGLGKMSVYLFSGDSSRLEQFIQFTQNLVEATFVGSPEEVPQFHYVGPHGNLLPADATLESLSLQPPYASHDVTSVLMFDEPWARDIADRIVPLNEQNAPRINWRAFRSEQYDFLKPACLPSGQGYSGAPFYANFSVLAWRKDLIRRFFETRPERRESARVQKAFASNGNLAQRRGDGITWELLLDAAQAVGDHLGVLPFYFDRRVSGESASSLLLELLWPYVWSRSDSGRILNVANDECIAALKAWRALVPRTVEVQSRPIMETHRFRAGVGTVHSGTLSSTHGEFVLARLWYSDVLAAREALGHDALDYAPIPPVGYDIAHGNVMTGHWYLGVLSGSRNFERATDLLAFMTGEQIRSRLDTSSAALAPDALWLEGESASEKRPNLSYRPCELLRSDRQDRLCSRSSFRGYAYLSHVLAYAMRRLMTGASITEKQIEDTMGDVQARLDRIYDVLDRRSLDGMLRV